MPQSLSSTSSSSNLLDEYREESSGHEIDDLLSEVPECHRDDLKEVFDNKSDILESQSREKLSEFSKTQLKYIIGLLIGCPEEFVTEDFSIRDQYLRIAENISPQKTGVV